MPWVIAQVNQDTTDTTFSPDVIDFSIGSGGAQTITLSSALPQITNPVVIDGASQGGQTGYSGPPLVTIDGSSLSTSTAILSVADGSSTIEGLAIVGGPGAGIVLTGAGENLVQGCYIGTPDGTSAEANAEGILVIGSANNTISGNVISGNAGDGLDLTSNSTATLIQDNIIGLNADGTAILGNGGLGIDQNGAHQHHDRWNRQEDREHHLRQ